MFLDPETRARVRAKLEQRFENRPLAIAASLSELELFATNEMYAMSVMIWTKTSNPEEAITAFAVLRGAIDEKYDLWQLAPNTAGN